MITVLSRPQRRMLLAQVNDKFAVRFVGIYPYEAFRRLLLRFRSEFPLAEFGEDDGGQGWWLVTSDQFEGLREFAQRNRLLIAIKTP